jgi:hypothetical protein
MHAWLAHWMDPWLGDACVLQDPSAGGEVTYAWHTSRPTCAGLATVMGLQAMAARQTYSQTLPTVGHAIQQHPPLPMQLQFATMASQPWAPATQGRLAM